MGYALQEEESGNYPFLIFLERSSQWRLLPLLEELAKNPRVRQSFCIFQTTVNIVFIL